MFPTLLTFQFFSFLVFLEDDRKPLLNYHHQSFPRIHLNIPLFRLSLTQNTTISIRIYIFAPPSSSVIIFPFILRSMIRVERIGMARIFTNLIDRAKLTSRSSYPLFGSMSVIIKGRFFEMGTELVIRHLLGEPRETWTP